MARRTLHGEEMLTEAGRAEWGARDARASALATSPYKKDFPLLASNPTLAFLDSAATAHASPIVRAQPEMSPDMPPRFFFTLNTVR